MNSLVGVQIERQRNVVIDQPKQRIAGDVRDIGSASGVEVVEAQHVVAAQQETVAQVRTEKARSARYQHLFRATHLCPSEGPSPSDEAGLQEPFPAASQISHCAAPSRCLMRFPWRSSWSSTSQRTARG